MRPPGSRDCQDMYRSRAVSGSEVTADGSIGVFALATVGLTGKGSLNLTFYRLTDSREPLTVRTVRLIAVTTMTNGREVHFNNDGVSAPVTGEFSYSTYFPGIPIQVEFSSGDRTWSREMNLEPNYAPNYIKGISVEPSAPKTIAEFRALPRHPATRTPFFPKTELP